MVVSSDTVVTVRSGGFFMKYTISIVVICMCFAGVASADTPVSGEITADMVWGLTSPDPGGVYLVTDDVTVRNSATLTIEAGVEVRFGYRNNLYIGGVSEGDAGKLLAQGTEGQVILFTADTSSPSPGYSGDIHFRSEAMDSSLMSYCEIEYGGGFFGSIYIVGCAPGIDQCEIRFSGYGINCSYGAAPIIAACSIHDCVGSGIIVNDSGPDISDTQIHNNDTGVSMTNTSGTITNCQIYQNTGVGLSLASGSITVSGSTFTQNGSWPVTTIASLVNNFSGNFYINNSVQQIQVGVETLTGDTSWENPGIPYLITSHHNVDELRVQGTDGPDQVTTLTLSPGTALAFDPDTRLIIGHETDPDLPGALNAAGSESSKIIFTSNGNPQAPGDWKGILLGTHLENEPSRLIHCIIEYGGQFLADNIDCGGNSPVIYYMVSRYSAGNGLLCEGSPLIFECEFNSNTGSGIYIRNGSPDIIDTHIYDNMGCGLTVMDTWPGDASPEITSCQIYGNTLHGVYLATYAYPEVSGCNINGNGACGVYIYDVYPEPLIWDSEISDNNSYPISCFAGDLSGIRGNTYSGNTIQKIEVKPELITRDVTWHDPGIPYLLTGDLTVAGEDSLAPVLTIQPGVEVQFDRYCQLTVGSSSVLSPGGLMVNGTEFNPVLFTQNDTYPLNPGEWKGISFLEFARDDLCVLRHAVIEYGGYGTDHAVYCKGSSPTFQHCAMEYHDGAGVYCTNAACPEIAGCSIHNNIDYGVFCTGPGTDPIITGTSLTAQDYGIYAEINAEPVVGGTPGEGNNFVEHIVSGVSNLSFNTCINARFNWWGDPDGPDDSSNAIDDCVNGGNDSVEGDSVSDDVDYGDWAEDPVESPTPLPTYTPTFTPMPTFTPTRTSTPTVTPTPSDTATPEPTTTCTPYEIYSDIMTDTIWGLSSPGCGIYRITTDISVRNFATLTIDPGVIVYFDAQCELIIGGSSPLDPGSLVASGTEEEVILFTGSQPTIGFYDGIRINQYGSCFMEMCIVEYGGYGASANIDIYGSSPEILTTISRYGQSGLAMHNGGMADIQDCSFIENNSGGVRIDQLCFPAITRCLFEGNGGVPLTCYAEDIHSITANTYVANVNQYIGVMGDTITDDSVWENPGVPYVIYQMVTVQGQDGPDNMTSVTIDPGVTLLMDLEGGFTIGHDSNAFLAGALKVMGTQSEPVVITANSPDPDPGHWYGIYFADYADDANSELTHCRIEYGGRDSQYNIVCNSASPGFYNVSSSWSDGPGITCTEGAQPIITNCTLEHNMTCGLDCMDSSPELIDSLVFANTTSGVCIDGASAPQISGCDISANGGYGVYVESSDAQPSLTDNLFAYNISNPVRLFAGQVGLIQGTNTYQDNLINKIYVVGEIISQNSTWIENAIPLFIDGDISVRGSMREPAVLTVNEGVELQFAAMAELTIGYIAAPEMGGLTVNGLPGSEVRFTCSDDLNPAPGIWGGIHFTYNAIDEYCILNHAIVEYGGFTGSHGVYCDSVSPRFYNCIFRFNEGAGIYCYNSAGPVIDECILNSNTQYGLYVSGAGAAPVLTRSHITGNQDGVRVAADALPVIGGSPVNANNIFGNTNTGVVNEIDVTCVNANWNWWGDWAGPNDTLFLTDDCMNNGNANPPGDNVSEDVDYSNWIENPVSTPTPPCINHGDVNSDGSITSGDAQAAFNIVLGLYQPTFEESCAADCTGDGTVTAGDAQEIFYTVLGMGSCVDPLD